MVHDAGSHEVRMGYLAHNGLRIVRSGTHRCTVVRIPRVMGLVNHWPHTLVHRVIPTKLHVAVHNFHIVILHVHIRRIIQFTE